MTANPAKDSPPSLRDGGGAWSGKQMLLLPLLLVVLLAFNALFTFTNVAATPWVRPAAALSVELGVLLVAIGLYRAVRLRLGSALKLALALILFIAVLLRYADVTAPTIFARELNFYWDLRHVPDLVVMFWQSAGIFRALAVFLTAILVVLAFMAFSIFGLTVIDRAAARRWGRAGLIAIGAAVIALFVLDRTGHALHKRLAFAKPVSVSAAHQVALLTEAWRLQHGGIASFKEVFGEGVTAMSGRGRPDGSDVFVIFLESYGDTVVDDQRHFARMKPRYEKMQASLDAAGWHVVSRRIEAPTFGGGSWRSHGTLLSGLRLSDQTLYNLLLSTDHKTLVSYFKDAGYRAIAAMPGIKRAWPEGAFFGFDRIYDDKGLQYPGPDFGFWRIPDQYTLFRTHETEIAAAKQPLFAVLVLINSHMPFLPLPPYVNDWSLFATNNAYETGSGQPEDQSDPNRRYMDAILYEFDIVEDFITDFLPKDALLIVLGDHQPAGTVSGPDADWTVPIHVFSRDPGRLAPFRNAGFESGLVPTQRTSEGMENVPGLVLEAASLGRSTAVSGHP